MLEEVHWLYWIAVDSCRSWVKVGDDEVVPGTVARLLLTTFALLASDGLVLHAFSRSSARSDWNLDFRRLRRVLGQPRPTHDAERSAK